MDSKARQVKGSSADAAILPLSDWQMSYSAAICKATGIDPADTAMSRDAQHPHPNPPP
jgi:hypothetical protein